MPKRDPLRSYREKRHFRRTPEPRGAPKKSGRRPIFVIQTHDATSLHYDFRLEIDGVLKSWAVPKGPSLNPKVKRLAMPTEDHPVAYARFEGVIPGGEYGAGTVLLWDRGVYQNQTARDDKPVPAAQAMRRGHLRVWLEGKKLRGGFALTRLGNGARARWILVKTDDKAADRRRNPVRSEPDSVVSGRTLQEIARGTGPGKPRGGKRRARKAAKGKPRKRRA